MIVLSQWSVVQSLARQGQPRKLTALLPLIAKLLAHRDFLHRGASSVAFGTPLQAIERESFITDRMRRAVVCAYANCGKVDHAMAELYTNKQAVHGGETAWRCVQALVILALR